MVAHPDTDHVGALICPQRSLVSNERYSECGDRPAPAAGLLASRKLRLVVRNCRQGASEGGDARCGVVLCNLLSLIH